MSAINTNIKASITTISINIRASSTTINFDINTSIMSSPIKVAIVGAGPAGLTLARLLHVQGTPFTIYDLDTSMYSRNAGGTLDLHKTTGQAALAAGGLTEEFHKVMRIEGEATRIADKTGYLHFDNLEPGFDRPEIDRLQLRTLLVKSIPADNIQWGHKVAGVDAETGRVRFADGSTSTTEFDLIVGADGAWSRVRPALTDVRPYYSGVTCIDMKFADAEKLHPEIAALVGLGSYYCFSDGKAILAQVNGDGSIKIYVMLLVPEDWVETCGIDFGSPAAARTTLLSEARYFRDWAPTVSQLVGKSDDEDFGVRKLFMLPVGHTWEHRAGLTLMGDAAHLMTPFAGVGVNVAMKDALDLAEALKGCSGKDDLAERVKAYEVGMWKNGAENAQDTWESLKLFFEDPESPKGFVARMGNNIEGSTEILEGTQPEGKAK
ncbi:monooxygenase, FAD-binding protein [Geopyxis carbonaria]|nr:monooxygenase, FAD-binding protein [Geopyxis carbonaria]